MDSMFSLMDLIILGSGAYVLYCYYLLKFKGEIKEGDTRAIASEIYGLICSTLVYKKREGEDMDVMRLYHEYENTVINGLRVK